MKSKILFVEDDQLVREAYEEALLSAGYDVQSAVDGMQGLAMAREGGYALVLLDIMLPKLDGLGILRELKKQPPDVKNGPVVVLTNLSHDPVIEEAAQLGAIETLVKSDIDPGILLETVKKYIG
ncbi:MAG TPA: response regulator [Candidatus Saccharimonadales bacterium]|nr:response regulator [Candidatus Saccharimonadales bacterium]